MSTSERASIASELDGLPPSAKLVAKVLMYEGELTQQELVDETFLCRRTVRYATNRLDEEGLLVRRPNLDDARQDVYDLDVDTEVAIA